jgi:asparagine synthase (glutamine-hydrolysing)
MCGICGVVYSDPRRRAEAPLVKRMMDSLIHRGPDGEGLTLDANAGLGHRRLSIIDLSETGAQPMATADDRYWITYNGEIYNYLELRKDLVARGRRFRGTSDTEVILELFATEGPRCVEKLNGMFAFAIWDSRKRTLFAARDRFGVKPFYYAAPKGAFVFGSEIKALLASGLVKPSMNPEALADYLAMQLALGEKTLFGGVHKLLPAHTLTVSSDGRVSTRRYWELPTELDMRRSEGEFRDELRTLLKDSVRIELRSDVPVGAYLSGGLDSSAISCIAGPLLKGNFKTFAGAYKEGPQYDEKAFAAAASRRAGSEHHRIFLTAKDFVDSMPRLIYHMDEPAAGPGIFAQHFVSKLAAKHVKVVLGGQGGDEVFAGYTRYLVAYLEQCLKGGIEGTQLEKDRWIVTFDSILPNLRELKGYEPMLKEFWHEGLFDAADKRYYRLINRGHEIRPLINPGALPKPSQYDPFDSFRAVFHESKSGSYISKMTTFDQKAQLPGLLQVEDRASMAASLESRVPLLDHRIAELVASMPPMIKYKGGRSKHIFRQAVKPVLPAEVYDRTDKMGFPMPLTEWLREGPVHDFVRETLQGGAAKRHGLIDTKQVAKLLDTERPYGRGVWGLLCLELWMKNFIDGKTPAAF